MSRLIRRKGLLQSAVSGVLSIPIEVQQDTPAGFPILIHESMFPAGHPVWAFMQTNGGDLRAYTDAGLTAQIPVDAYATNRGAKTLKWWTRLPSAITTGNPFYITVGNTGTPLTQPATTDTFGRRAVWADFQHATHDFDVNLVDDDAWTINGAQPQSGPSGLPALGFHTTLGTANTDDVQTDDGSRPTIFTWIGWVNERTLAPGGVSRRIFAYQPFEYRDAGSLAEMRIAAAWSGATAEWSAARPTADTWQFTVIRYDATSTANDPTLRRNKSNITLTETTAPSGTLNAGAGPMTYGNFDAASSVALDGRITEPRLVAGSLLSDAFVDALYDNQNAPGSFAVAQPGVLL
jgi:hypothetical protein